ncbi:MAG TPA: alanine racemase [Candidatus Limnocylindrales bacterium]|nr:alanine racemase [Candidatus Limnocylindrales bacterium]
MTEPAARPPIEARLSAAGLPPLPRTAWLEIDLDALRANLGVVRALAGPGQPVRPVVKADAYGHGAVPVAAALEAAGADGFCVAAMDEAVELRDGGIRAPILVLYPVPAVWVGVAARLRIAVTGGSPETLADIVGAAADLDGVDPLAIELEVETGFGRGGFLVEELAAAARLVASSPGTELAGLWTHLQAAPNPTITASQADRFAAAAAALTEAGIHLPTRHVAASEGLLGDLVLPYEGVRPGLITYGLLPDELDTAGLPAAAARLRPAMALYARPVRVADLPAGTGISYGPTFRTARPSRIATLPVGYGDGFSRRLSNRASAIVRGTRVPLVGNVTMDAVMADVTDVAGPPVDGADEFTLLGGSGPERLDVRDLAPERTTNSWEVVVAMSRRLPRVYHAAADPVGLRTLTEPRG